ncbi:MAG TPA: hypothetical protein VN851_15705 [Thermoanaerobaculia bacterium]|nr:hypothetical protein [Thermoanaerobaculia bacterium]
MQDTSYADKINKWQVNVDTIEPDLAQYPGSQDFHAELKSLVSELRVAHGSVEIQRGDLRTAVKSRRELATKSRRVSRRLAAIVRAHAGFDNPKLVTYGLSTEDQSRRGKRPAVVKAEESESAAS